MSRLKNQAKSAAAGKGERTVNRAWLLGFTAFLPLTAHTSFCVLVGSQLAANQKALSIQCKICLTPFLCTSSESKLKEHSDSKHPKARPFAHKHSRVCTATCRAHFCTPRVHLRCAGR